MKKLLSLACCALLLGLAVLGTSRPALAAYPDRPVNIIIPFGPGGAVDIAARIIAEYLQGKGITLNIVCKGGGAGAPAMLDVARARPDGYTFGFPAVTTFSTTPQAKPTGYSLKDFKAVVQITDMVLSLAVRSDSGITNVRELFEAAKANPGKINFATHGAFSTQRLFMLMLQKKLGGVEIPHVAYTSGHDVSTALLGGHITSAFGVTTNQLPYVQAGNFRIIGVSSKERVKDLPDAPTFAEQFDNDQSLVFPSPHGLVAPRRTPDDKIIAMQNLIKEALADPGVQAKMAKAGLTCDYLPHDEFQKVMDRIWTTIGKVLKENNMVSK